MLNREEVERPVDLIRVVVILFSVRRRIRILFVFLLVCCVTSHTTGENLAGLLKGQRWWHDEGKGKRRKDPIPGLVSKEITILSFKNIKKY